MRIPGEREAIEQTLEYAEIYGYGNLIAHIKGAWIKHLMEFGSSEKTARLAADTEPIIDSPILR